MELCDTRSSSNINYSQERRELIQELSGFREIYRTQGKDGTQRIYGTQGSETGNMEHKNPIQGTHGTQGSDTGNIWNTGIRSNTGDIWNTEIRSDTGNLELRGQIQGIWNTRISYMGYGAQGSDTGNMKHRDQVQGYMEHKGQIQVIWSIGI